MDLPAVRARGAPILRGMPGLCGQREIQRATGANRGPTSAARPTGTPARTLNPAGLPAPTRGPASPRAESRPPAGLRAASRGPASARAVCRSTAVRRLAHMAADPPFCVRLSGRGRWSVLRGALFPWWNSGGFHAGREYPGEGSGQTESPPKVRRDIRYTLRGDAQAWDRSALRGREPFRRGHYGPRRHGQYLGPHRQVRRGSRRHLQLQDGVAEALRVQRSGGAALDQAQTLRAAGLAERLRRSADHFAVGAPVRIPESAFCRYSKIACN